MNERSPRLSRRHFLLSVGAGGAASAAVLVAKNPPTVQSPEKTEKRSTRGYRETGHVNHYYRTAKI